MYKIFLSKLRKILIKNHYDFNLNPSDRFFRFLYRKTEGGPMNIKTIRNVIQQYNEVTGVNLLLIRSKFPITQILKGSRNLVQILGRKHSPVFKITNPNGQKLSATLRDRMSTLEEKFQLDFSPVKTLSPLPGGVAEMNGQLYQQDMSTPELAVWRMLTPSKPRVPIAPSLLSPEVTKPAEDVLSYFSATALPSHVRRFEFSVTLAELLSRKGTPRPISQIKVMDGKRAEEVLKNLGALICDKQGPEKYHWAHRQGWALGGEQSQDNLDPTTAGSNYDTLFKVEQPIYDLLMDGTTKEVFVKGLVILHSITPIPKKIIYEISTEQMASPIHVYIDPMSHRIPTVEESTLSEELLRKKITF